MSVYSDDYSQEVCIEPIYYPMDLGFVSNRYTDQSEKLQELIDFVSNAGGGTIDFQDQLIAISKKIYVKSNVVLYNGNIRFIGLAQIVVQHDNVTLAGMLIDSSGYGNGSMGVIEFVESTNATMERVHIIGNHLYKGFLCKTKATDTKIIDCSVTGLGWGILWNDSIVEQGPTWRVFDGITYDGPIGVNLEITGFRFKPSSIRFGDGIEINTPDYAFMNVSIRKCTIDGANATQSNGIGIGMANVFGATIEECKVYNTKFDGYHIEKGSGHTIRDCYAFNCGRALGLSHNTDTLIEGNTFEKCGTWLSAYSRLSQYQQMRNVIIRGNLWDGTTTDPELASRSYGCLISNTSSVNIEDNIFKGYAGSSNTALIQFYNAGVTSVYDSEISDNIFYPDTSTVIPNAMISLLDGADNNKVLRNTFHGGYTDKGIKAGLNNVISENITLFT